MGKHKKYTPRAFEKAVAAYFASICYVEPVVQTVPVLEELPDGTQRVKLDRYGHQMFTLAAVKTADGKGATRLSVCGNNRKKQDGGLRRADGSGNELGRRHGGI